VAPVADSPDEGGGGGIDDRHHAHEQAGRPLLVPGEQRDVAGVDEERKRGEDHAARGEAQRKVECSDCEKAAIAHRADGLDERARRDGGAPVRHRRPRADERHDDRTRRDLERRRVADRVRQQPSDHEPDRDAEHDRRAHGARRATAVSSAPRVKGHRLRRDEHASRSRPMQKPPREEERAWMACEDAEGIEPHHHDLEHEPDEQRGSSAEAIGHDSDPRARDDSHRAIRREDDADERQRETEAHPRDW
jgi:hypothetical protein